MKVRKLHIFLMLGNYLLRAKWFNISKTVRTIHFEKHNPPILSDKIVLKEGDQKSFHMIA